MSSASDFIPRRDDAQEGEGKKRPQRKIYRDKKNGRRYVKAGRKKKYLPEGLGKNDLVKWLVQHFTKRKKREAAVKHASKEETHHRAIHESTTLPAERSGDDTLRHVVNHERVSQGLEPLDPPTVPGKDAPIAAEALEERKRQKEERKKKHEAEKKALEDRALESDAKLDRSIEESAHELFHASYSTDAVRKLVPPQGANGLTERCAEKS